MSIPNLALKRNLRKNILQGQPWIYKENLNIPVDLKETVLCKVLDPKNEFLGWGIFSPQSPLAVRILSLDKKPPNPSYYEGTLNIAKRTRDAVIDDSTNCYRLVNGEGDYMPGFICDIYSHVAVMQFDGQSLYDFWDQEFLSDWILKNTKCKTVYFKPRHDSNLKPQIWGEDLKSNLIEVKENNIRFLVDVVQGQKTGFFLDQRENRKYLSQISKDKSVINLFSYSGGFSLYAGLGGAKSVVSVDIAQGALDLSNQIWKLNEVTVPHQTVCADVFDYLSPTSNIAQDKFDIVICDPPSLAKSEAQKEIAMQKYIDTYALAAKKVNSEGHLVLSSCSSHISFADFEIIVNEALSKARKRGQTLRYSGQGSDHPYPQACPHLRYLKFIDLKIF